MQSQRLIFYSQKTHRLFSSTSFVRATAFPTGPAPPRLPKAEQELYEQLQRSSTGAFSTLKHVSIIKPVPMTIPPNTPTVQAQINQSPYSRTESPSIKDTSIDARVKATGDGEELHPDVRRGVKPEFEGERNPKTGEIGGPKNEPLRWGGEVDWSYNGRVTDF